MGSSMGKDNELREWALNHWKIYRSKYTGEVIDFERSSLENWRNLKLEKPIAFSSQSDTLQEKSPYSNKKNRLMLYLVLLNLQ